MEPRTISIQRIMLLSHEMGHEMGQEEVIRKAKRITRYFREKEKITNVSLDYSLHYWQEVLGNRYYKLKKPNN